MKILVSGCAGFLGSHLVDELLKIDNVKIVGLDNLSGGFKENLNPNIEFMEGDIRDESLINLLFRSHKFDYVFHLAAYAAEGLSPFIRKFNYETNLIGSINLINASINNNVKCFVFTSSMGVYGDSQNMDEDAPCYPIDPYGVSKLAVEMDLKSAYKTHGLNYIIFRPHNIYGEKQNIHDIYRNVVGIFMKQKLEGKKATVFNDGEQTRLFSYVKDITPILANSVFDEQFYQQTFNIGGEQSYTINELAKALDMEPDYVGYRYEVKHTNPLHTKIKRFISDYKTTPLAEGLANMWEWAQTIKLKEPKLFDALEITKNLPDKWKQLIINNLR